MFTQDSRHHLFEGPFCFEKYQVYEIKLNFSQLYAPYAPNYFRAENLKLLIDSVSYFFNFDSSKEILIGISFIFKIVLVPYLDGKFTDHESNYARTTFDHCRRQIFEYNPYLSEFCKWKGCEIDWIGVKNCDC